MTRWPKFSLLHQHTLNYDGLHKVLVNVVHIIGFRNILSDNVFVVLVQSEFFFANSYNWEYSSQYFQGNLLQMDGIAELQLIELQYLFNWLSYL